MVDRESVRHQAQAFRLLQELEASRLFVLAFMRNDQVGANAHFDKAITLVRLADGAFHIHLQVGVLKFRILRDSSKRSGIAAGNCADSKSCGVHLPSSPPKAGGEVK